MANKKADGTVLSSFTYVYDDAGNRTRMTYADGRTIDYGYDNAYQLTGEVKRNPDASVIYDQAWTYDPAGNRLTQVKDGVATNYAYDSNNRMLSAGAKTFSYDNNGNTISETDGGVTTTYSYDYENHLTATSAGETFAYDQRGLRVRKVSGGVDTRFLYDGWRVWGETDAAGVTQAVYTHGRGRWDLLSQRRGGVSLFYAFDALGSARHLTDGGQSLTDGYDYDAWGVVTGASGSSANPYRYVGRLGYYADAAERLLLTYRFYLPASGTFATADPARDKLNWYMYVDGNPAGLTDPLGLWSWDRFWDKCRTFCKGLGDLACTITSPGPLPREPVPPPIVAPDPSGPSGDGNPPGIIPPPDNLLPPTPEIPWPDPGPDPSDPSGGAGPILY